MKHPHAPVNQILSELEPKRGGQGKIELKKTADRFQQFFFSGAFLDSEPITAMCTLIDDVRTSLKALNFP
ncbi:MAG: hypothetical protein A3I44_01955 [Candidatus Sungbacteria bacterium RIFCSPLOWO2_02_FULL_51_17]|nr:MAG: hypothetical protein A2676_04095 [Candidatus Sungbacteria bacterium RIFCSPHIGHO2_01_FULL_51_22]OHA07842.1 MAG: hypothetical protein A3B29_00710 [Candidatus Sungbacteria bacterium RIFCSPLOWO2_01_FULL_51_34]OHA11424.1 MAG: hypothetical protein A3I44_01955 [Candidatus Sungbacteria bacterium RIFCSPLOWO2_02_FULL_51_17]